MKRLPSLAGAKWLKAQPLQKVFAAIEAAGGEARVAGGAVRNALMKVAVADIDLATTLEPAAVAAACAAAGLAVHPTGIDHGTVTVVSDRQPFEITTLRHDIETFGRRARVEFTDDWQADAMRRDFTMNALYCDRHGKISDFTNGYRDILRKRVIFAGKPRQRIEEDHLRILRFFRFHAQFGKGSPDRAGLEACVRSRRKLKELSAERIRQEMFKLLAAPGAVATLKLMAKCGVLDCILKFKEEWRVLARLPADPILRLAVLAADPGSMKQLWRLSNREGNRLASISETAAPSPALRPKEQRAVLYRIGSDAWHDLVLIGWARSKASLNDRSWKRLLQLPEKWKPPLLPVTGHDVIATGMTPGPGVGAALKRLEDWWIATDFKAGRDQILARLRS